MAALSLPQVVRDLVRAQFAAHGAPADDFHETILIRDGIYCGRRYESGDLSAIWFVEKNELKLYAADGTTIELTPPHQPPVAPQGTEHRDVA